jgi:hypothetical protein
MSRFANPCARQRGDVWLRSAPWLRGIALVALMVVSGAGWAQNTYKPTRADWNSIRKIIQAQVDAFREDKGELAFSYAAPPIREHFKTAANFMRVVKTSYHAVYRPASMAFIDTSVDDGTPIQVVQFSDADGAVWIGFYSMQRQRDKSWKINGCQLVPGKAVST